MDIIQSSLRNGKNVVTANKKLLAEHNEEILETITSTGNSLGYEAAVGGGIPCILALKKGLVGNQIRSILGILNGTTNYILTKMEREGLTFESALADAQEKGFAEANPTFDVEGIDAGHKIALLAMLAYGKSVDFSLIPIEGVITSYSIHYTKLYDLTINETESGWFRLTISAMNHGTLPADYDTFIIAVVNKDTGEEIGTIKIPASDKVYNSGAIEFQMENPKGANLSSYNFV